MKKNLYLCVPFVLLALLLSACGLSVTPVPATATATPPLIIEETPGSADDPNAVPTEEVFSPYLAYYNADGDFSLALPIDWVAGDPVDGTLGKQVMLGPDPSVDTSSTVIVADAAKVNQEQAITELCKDCDPQPTASEVKINGMPATRIEAQMGGPDTPPIEWFLLPKDNKLIIFSLHDPDLLQSLDSVIGSFTPGKQEFKDPKFGAAVWAAQESLAAEVGVNPYQVTAQNVQPVQWPDACLSAGDQGEECAQEVTPGFVGTVRTREQSAEFHVNNSGSQVRLIPGAAIAVRQAAAAEKKLDVKAIKIVQFEPSDWKDGCFGLGNTGETCTQEIVSGYRVMLEIDGKQIEYRTNMNGNKYREVKQQPQ